MYATIIKQICLAFQKPDAKLLPLRLFIGLGWLRAGIEKIVDPNWHDSSAIITFLQEQIGSGSVVFPFYHSLMTGPFAENAHLLSNLIMAGEFYVGLGILFGFLTKPALIAGLFMNLNFILAGSVNPSAFYIIIQMMLLTSNVGQVLGLDAVIVRLKKQPLSAQYLPIAEEYKKMNLYLGGALLAGLMALLVTPFIQSADPVTSIDDPAMLLLVLFGLCSVLLSVMGVRARQNVQSWVANQDPPTQPLPHQAPPYQSVQHPSSHPIQGRIFTANGSGHYYQAH